MKDKIISAAPAYVAASLSKFSGALTQSSDLAAFIGHLSHEHKRIFSVYQKLNVILDSER
jgi:hypothetical protein